MPKARYWDKVKHGYRTYEGSEYDMEKLEASGRVDTSWKEELYGGKKGKSPPK